MIKLNRTTEYGLIALKHISQTHSESSDPVSAREIADTYGLPFEITAKTLQRLKESGLIRSVQGVRGGYTLGKDVFGVSLSQFIDFMEGKAGVVACCEKAGTSPTPETSQDRCEYQPKCEIHPLMKELNGRIRNFLSEISLGDLLLMSESAKKESCHGRCI